MDADVASSEVVPRFVDLALFLCGTALRNLRGELPSTNPAAVPLQRWYLHKVCFLHTLPNDNDSGAVPPTTTAAAETERAIETAEGEQRSGQLKKASLSLFTSPARSSSYSAAHTAADIGSREVNFTCALKHLRHALITVTPPVEQRITPAGKAGDGVAVTTIGHVHARSSSASLDASSPLSDNNAPDIQEPVDVGFSLLKEFLSLAYEKGDSPLVRRVAAALVYALMEHTEPPDTQEVSAADVPAMDAPSSFPSLSSSCLPVVRVSTLSRLFDEDLLGDELSMEAGNATRSFCIWVNYEWASASFLRQTRLAAVATEWLRELCRYRDGKRPAASCSCRCVLQRFKLEKVALSLLPTNLRKMYAALEGVFEGHTNTHKLLMEMALLQRTPHLTDNTVAKFLFLQGSSIAAGMSRGELANRGTQPILMSITSGMLLYAQYYISFRSLAVARQCVRVALQVAQEVHSNSVLALAHFTAHVVAVHQGRPADAANSISIALQLSLGNAATDGSTGGSGGGNGGDSGAAMSADGQMASVAFAGAAQLLLFFPGAVSSALRSVISTGQLSGAPVTEEDAGGGGAAPVSNAQGTVEDSGRHHSSGGGAVLVQTVAQSIRHAVRRAEASLLDTPPVEGRWVGVVAGLHCETLLLMGALYGIVSTPTIIDETSLKCLLDQVRKEASLTSPLFMAQGSRSLFWEVLRHTAHHALSLQEKIHFTEVPTRITGSTQALHCLRAAQNALRAHYGSASVELATGNVFFSGVVRYCAACHLQDGGYITAAHSLFTTVAERLGYAAGMEGSDTATAAGTWNSSSVSSDVDAATSARPQCWSPDLLLLYALAQRRRVETAAFLGLVSVLSDAPQALLAVSSRYSFSFGVLTAQLMEAQVHQHNCRYNAALVAARCVEHSALRIGYPTLVETACALQITAHASSGDWRAAQRVFLRLQPRHGGHRVFLLLYKFAVHLELLLAEPCISSHDVTALIRNWLTLMQKEKLLSPSGTNVVEGTDVSLAERLCVLSALTRACGLLGNDVAGLQAETVACLQELQQRQGVPVPDIYVHGDCEEVCQHNLSY